MSLSNDIEKVEISHFPNPNQNFIPGQPFGNESIKLNITENNISENNLTVHILSLNSNNYYGKLFGRNSSETVKNETNNLFQSNYTLNGTELILDNFIINQQSIYDSFNLMIFVNGVPSNSEVPVKLCFPHQDLNLNLTWNTSIPFVSGYNKIPSQPILQITNSTGEPIQGYYAYFSILNDSVEVIDFNTGITGDILSTAPSNSSGYVTWNISFLKILYNDRINSYFWIPDCQNPTLDYYNTNKIEKDLNVSIEEFNWKFFDIPSQIFYNQPFPISPKVLVSNQNTNEPISNKYIIFQMQNSSDNTQYIDIKTEITNENGIATFSNLFLDLEEEIEEINIQFICDYKSYSQDIKIIYEPTHIQILSSARNHSQIGIPFIFPNQSITFNNKNYLGSFIVQLFSFSIPISGKPITAKLISQNSENGKLDPSTSLEITDENGIAVFNLRMESGNFGYYQIEFSYLNSISITSDPIYVQIPIQKVNLIPTSDFPNELEIGNTFSATINITFFEYFENFENISFPINIITKCSDASFSNDNIVKKPNNEMVLNNLKFDSVSGNSECLNKEGKVKAEIAFSVLGIQSNFQTILITSPDKIVVTKAIDSLKQSFLFWVLVYVLFSHLFLIQQRIIILLHFLLLLD
ncbi:hypothetical protein M0811_11189 [Anaeramoeba ignava]|uniref:Uncharacterized protein n=1 Tax=Anaeramoeba ignava TaxID=1746090 RepID=A0A9Q0LF89_ANAIG|nr:hypothetical protein M0811_11189 [Anaeramoeba ignava]